MPVRKLGPLVQGVKPDNSTPTEPNRVGIEIVDPGYDPASDNFSIKLQDGDLGASVRPTQVLVYVTTPDKAPAPENNTPEWWESQGFPTSSVGVPESGDPGVLNLHVEGIPFGPVYAQTVIEYPA